MADNPINNSGDASFENEMQKLTARAKQVLVLSQKEALRFNHDYVGTEHLLQRLTRDIVAQVADIQLVAHF